MFCRLLTNPSGISILLIDHKIAGGNGSAKFRTWQMAKEEV